MNQPVVASAKATTPAPPPRSEWQEDAWAYYDAVPELKHAVRFVGNAMGRLRLFPAVDDDQGIPMPVDADTSPVPPTVAAAALAELDRLRSPIGGQSEILKTLAQNLEVAGEGYVHGIPRREVEIPGATPGAPPTVETTAESWTVRSVSEISVEGAGKHRKYRVKSSPSDRGTVVADDETLIRVWQRHPRWGELPDCALAALLTDCEAIHTLSLLGIGDANSKRNNGFLLIPSELTLGSANQAEDDEVDDPDEDPAFRALGETVQGPIADPSSPSAVQPTLIRGPAEALKEVRHVLAQRPDASVESKIEARVRRLARGIDLPVEVTEGHQSTTFANAAQVDRDTWEDYLEPRAELLVDALTFGFYSPNLAENPAVPTEWAERIYLWFDESGVVSAPAAADTADAAHDRLTISDAAYRAAKGFGPDDAPDDEELLRRTGLRRGILTGDITAALLRLLDGGGGAIEILPLPEAPPAQPGDPTAATAAIDAGSREADRPPRLDALTASAVRASNAGARLLTIDQDLRSRLVTAADAALGRALERAGNRLRSKSKRLAGVADTVHNVPAVAVAATLGPTLVASVAGDDDLLAGAWDELEHQFRTWAGAAQSEALDVAAQVTAGFTTDERAALGVRQAADVDEAWAWMRGSLDSLARGYLFSPDPTAPDAGEFDPSARVPTGLVRQAMSRAGGATGLVTSGADAWVAIYPNGLPVGMLATGELIGDVLREGGAGVEGYVWVYGPGSRRHPFEPHQDLDGATFVNFDDPVLANTDGFPAGAFYFPGDHAGCLCDFEPVIIPADDAADLAPQDTASVIDEPGSDWSSSPEGQQFAADLAEAMGNDPANVEAFDELLRLTGTTREELASVMADSMVSPADFSPRELVDLVGETALERRGLDPFNPSEWSDTVRQIAPDIAADTDSAINRAVIEQQAELWADGSRRAASDADLAASDWESVLGGHVHVVEVSPGQTDAVDRFTSSMDLLPVDTVRFLSRSGVEFGLTDGRLSDLGEGLGSGFTRDGRQWDTVRGVFSPTVRNGYVAVAGSGSGGSVDVVLHEAAHALDYALRPTMFGGGSGPVGARFLSEFPLDAVPDAMRVTVRGEATTLSTLHDAAHAIAEEAHWRVDPYFDRASTISTGGTEFFAETYAIVRSGEARWVQVNRLGAILGASNAEASASAAISDLLDDLTTYYDGLEAQLPAISRTAVATYSDLYGSTAAGTAQMTIGF